MIRHGSPSQAAALPPLRIHHFLLWTVTTAGWVAVARFLVGPGSLRNFGYELTAALVTEAMVSGAATAVAGLGFIWWLKGLPFYTEPGHWLATLYLGWRVWLIVAALLASYILPTDSASASGSWLSWPIWEAWLSTLVPMVIYFVLVRSGADTIPWSLYFLTEGCVQIALAASLLSTTLSSVLVFGWGQWLLYLASPVALLTATVHDIRQRDDLPRHWTHWTAVAVYLPFYAIMLLYWLGESV